MEIDLVCVTVQLFVVLLRCVVVTCAVDTRPTVDDVGKNYFRFRSETQLHRMTVDPISGSLYVGATNRLYRFDRINDTIHLTPGEAVRPADTVSLGPRFDHPLCTEAFGDRACSGGGTTSRFEPAPTDNVVKVLAIDPVDRKLITCGSIFQVCS